jgi:acyl carrier protein
MLVESGWAGARSFRVLCGGEALSRDLANALLGRAGAVWNLYGPTETTIWSTIHSVSEDGSFVPIGRPIANTRLYLLDPNGQPVPIGVPGELYIGGAGVARGYLNRPELTAEKFVADPFSKDPDARLYRTGDRARYRADGTVEYMGRLDAQVKVRGFRVEPGEIEAALTTHPGVREAAVVLCESGGAERLVAYLVFEAGAPSAPGELRAYLKKTLPDPMIPAAFVSLEALPLTPSGKLARKALPDPDWNGLRSEGGFRPPRTVVEKTLADIWSQTLSVREIGVEDNFFQVGGDSLLATRILSRVRDAFGVELSLMNVFETSTIEEMAGAIESARRGASAPAASSIEVIPRR